MSTKVGGGLEVPPFTCQLAEKWARVPIYRPQNDMRLS